MLDPQIYRVIITANKQTGLDLWKLAINAPTGMRGNPGANSRDSLRVSRRQVTRRETRHGATCSDRAERREITVLTEETPGKEGGFQRLFPWAKRPVCGVGEEAHSRHRCKRGRCLHPSSSAAQEGPVTRGP